MILPETDDSGFTTWRGTVTSARIQSRVSRHRYGDHSLVSSELASLVSPKFASFDPPELTSNVKSLSVL